MISGKTVGAVIPEATIKLQGINEIVNNEHNQFSDKQDKVPKLKPLHKQILSDETSVSFIAKGFEDDVELCDTVNSFYLARISTLEKLQLLFGSFADFDMNRIIITNKSLNNLSKAVYGDFSLLRRAVTYFYENQIEPDFEAKLESAKSEKAKVKLLAQKEFFVESNHSIEFLEKAVSFYQEGRENKAPESAIQQFFATVLIKDNNPIKVARATYNYLKGFLEKGVNGAQWKEGGKELLKLKDKQEITELKKMLDALMDVYHFARLLETTDEITENKDEVFYAELAQFKDEFGNMPALYDKVRNYITQKPYTKDKIKLNFGSATLLGGWDKNKEKTNLSTLLRKDGLYYLAIFKQDYRNVFDGMPVDSAGANFEKMVYKYIPSPSKMLPKVFLSKKGIATFHPPKHLLENYEKGTHKKGDDFNLEHCHELIDFFKKSLFAHEEWKHFGFEFSETKTYKDLSDIYDYNNYVYDAAVDAEVQKLNEDYDKGLFEEQDNEQGIDDNLLFEQYLEDLENGEISSNTLWADYRDDWHEAFAEADREAEIAAAEQYHDLKEVETEAYVRAEEFQRGRDIDPDLDMNVAGEAEQFKSNVVSAPKVAGMTQAKVTQKVEAAFDRKIDGSMAAAKREDFKKDFEENKAKLNDNDKVKVEAVRRILDYLHKDNPKELQAGYEKLTTAMKNGEISKLPDVPQQVVQQSIEIQASTQSNKDRGR